MRYIHLLVFLFLALSTSLLAQSTVPLLAPAVTYDSGGYDGAGVAVADVNGDGKPDIVETNLCGRSYCTPSLIEVLLGIGDGTFQIAGTYYSDGQHAST